MKKTERLKLIPSLAQRLAERDWADIQFVLREFDVEANSYNSSTDAYEYCLWHLSDVSDDDLLELDDYLGGRSEEAFHGSAGPWEEGHFRLFLSHLSAHKVFVGEVKTHLAGYGIDGFVAHSDIEPTEEWVRVIEMALGTCDALAAFLHPGFIESRWCDQEVGYVFGRRRLLIALMFGESPYGFLGLTQGMQVHSRNAYDVAEMIWELLWSKEELRPKLEDGLIEGLRASPNYASANQRAQRVERLVSEWTPHRIERLKAAAQNPEVTDAWTSGPIVKGMLEALAPAPPPMPANDEVPF